tara:strand:- start:1653 stop:1898 length:246 start_codon:yes stop_codon:yes gene_type:complete
MSIFPKNPIKAGDLVIGAKYRSWMSSSNHGRLFVDPSIVLEIKANQVLVFFEQSGPQWYDIAELERVYVAEEIPNSDVAKD